MQLQKIKSIKSIGVRKTLDFEVDHKDHNFFANGIVVSNSHSMAYSVVAALTVYYKFNYPKEFFLESLKIAANKSDATTRFNKIERELKYFGIKLLRPDVLKSDLDFSIDGQDIRFGLSAIKGIALKALHSLRSFVDTKTGGKFEVFEAAKKTKLSIAKLVALIQAGALSSFGDDRSLLVLEAQIWSKLSQKERDYCILNASKYDNNLISALKDFNNWIGNNGKPVSKSTRLDTIRRDTESFMEIYSRNRKYPNFTAYMYEKTLLGYSFSVSLIDLFVENHPRLEQIKYIKDKPTRSNVELVATVLDVMTGISKTGNNYLKLIISDETDIFSAMMLKDKLASFLERSPAPQEEDIVYIRGQKGDDIIWIDKLEIQNHKIYFKASEIKKELQKADVD